MFLTFYYVRSNFVNEYLINYYTNIDTLPKHFRNSEVQKYLDDEYEQLIADRKFYRKTFMKLEDDKPGQFLLDDSCQMPVNVYRIMEDIVYNYKSVIQELPKSKKTLEKSY